MSFSKNYPISYKIKTLNRKKFFIISFFFFSSTILKFGDSFFYLLVTNSVYTTFKTKSIQHAVHGLNASYGLVPATDRSAD